MKKTISILLLLVILLSQLGTVFATDYEGVSTTETTKTLTQYLIENGVDGNNDGVLSDEEWAKVKKLELTNIDLTGIEKAVNLEYLSLGEGCNVEVIDFSKFAKLEQLFLCDLTLNDTVQGNIGEIVSLDMLSISYCNGYTKINYSNLQKLRELYISYCSDDEKNYKIPPIKNLEDLGIVITKDKDMYIDLSELENIKTLDLTHSGTVKFPIFKDLEFIEVNSFQSLLYGWMDVEERFGYCVDGVLDLRNCDNVEGYLGVNIDDTSFLVNDDTFCTQEVLDGWNLTRLWSKSELEKIDLSVNDIFEIYEGKSLFELIENEDDKIAYFSTEGNGEEIECWIYALNEGTTKMKIKDALGHIATVKINVYDVQKNYEADPELENTESTAKFIDSGRYILKSNGELWEMDSETTARKIDTNVKDCINTYTWNIGTSRCGECNMFIKKQW